MLRNISLVMFQNRIGKEVDQDNKLLMKKVSYFKYKQLTFSSVSRGKNHAYNKRKI